MNALRFLPKNPNATVAVAILLCFAVQPASVGAQEVPRKIEERCIIKHSIDPSIHRERLGEFRVVCDSFAQENGWELGFVRPANPNDIIELPCIQDGTETAYVCLWRGPRQ